MEMWRIMVINIHIDDDSVEFTNFWHNYIYFLQKYV